MTEHGALSSQTSNDRLPSLDLSKLNKMCPDCAEEIKISARVCRFCGHQFTDEEISEAISEVESSATKSAHKDKIYYSTDFVTVTNKSVITKEKTIPVSELKQVLTITQVGSGRYECYLLNTEGEQLHFLHASQSRVDVLVTIAASINEAISERTGVPVVTPQIVSKSRSGWTWALIIGLGILIGAILISFF